MKTEIINGQKVKIYDNGGKSFDRITAVYLDQPERCRGIFEARAMSHGVLGFSMIVSAIVGPHLGKRVAFADLPENNQNQIKNDLKDFNEGTERLYRPLN